MNRLYERELGASSAAPRARASGTAAHEQRKVYAHLLPVRSVFDVAAPPLFVKRFTPDGRVRRKQAELCARVANGADQRRCVSDVSPSLAGAAASGVCATGSCWYASRSR